MPRGGYQKPSNPAPVSNPRSGMRTDGGPTQAGKYIPGGNYGEGKQLQELQASAPMAASPQPTVSAAGAKQAVRNAAPITPIDAPTMRPDEPLTAGMPFGAGPSESTFTAPAAQVKLSETLASILAYDTTGEVQEMYDYLVSRGL